MSALCRDVPSPTGEASMSLALLAAEPGTDAGRLADLLFAASPQRAAAFARARHEQLCQGCDEAETALWAKVAALLRGRF